MNINKIRKEFDMLTTYCQNNLNIFFLSKTKVVWYFKGHNFALTDILAYIDLIKICNDNSSHKGVL